MAYLSSFSIVLFLAFIFSSWFFRSAPVRQCLYNLHVLALKLILMHTACRVSWTCFGSHLFHLCSRGHFWVKVYYDVKGNRRFLPPPPPTKRGHEFMWFFYLQIYIYLKKWLGRAVQCLSILHDLKALLIFFDRAVLHLCAEGDQIESNTMAIGYNLCFKRNIRLLHCLLVQCTLRTTILA